MATFEEVVNDDFEGEYGVFFVLIGEGYTYEELKHTADFLKREDKEAQNLSLFLFLPISTCTRCKPAGQAP
jgi:hypothetical protein